jgi:hypothetical protein
MPVIDFQNEHRVLNVLPGTNLRQAALKAGVQLYKPLNRVFHVNIDVGPLSVHSASDVVEVIEAKGINARSEDEQNLVEGRFLKWEVTPAHRLASQVVVNGDITVRTMPQRTINWAATKMNFGYLTAVGVFFLFSLFLFLILGLDLIKKI